MIWYYESKKKILHDLSEYNANGALVAPSNNGENRQKSYARPEWTSEEIPSTEVKIP